MFKAMPASNCNSVKNRKDCWGGEEWQIWIKDRNVSLHILYHQLNGCRFLWRCDAVCLLFYCKCTALKVTLLKVCLTGFMLLFVKVKNPTFIRLSSVISVYCGLFSVSDWDVHNSIFRSDICHLKWQFSLPIISEKFKDNLLRSMLCV